MAKGGGGKREGAGRKSIAQEARTKDIARSAIIKKYGSLDEGLKHLLATEETILVKFVFEHAFGKPSEVVDVTTRGERIEAAIIKVYTTPVPMSSSEKELETQTPTLEIESDEN